MLVSAGVASKYSGRGLSRRVARRNDKYLYFRSGKWLETELEEILEALCVRKICLEFLFQKGISLAVTCLRGREPRVLCQL